MCKRRKAVIYTLISMDVLYGLWLCITHVLNKVCGYGLVVMVYCTFSYYDDIKPFLISAILQGEKKHARTHPYIHTHWWEWGGDTHILHCIRADGVSMSVCGSLGHYDYIKTRTSQTALQDKHWRTETCCVCVCVHWHVCMSVCCDWMCSCVWAWLLGEIVAS